MEIADNARRMGRPPLNKESETKMTGVRLTEDVRRRIEALVGPNRMATFIREAVDAELKRRESEKDQPGQPKWAGNDSS